MKKTIVSMILVLALLGSGMPVYAVDQEEPLFDTEAVSRKLETITSDLSESSLLEDEQVTALTKYQIEEYVGTEPFAEGKNIQPGEIESWIPLHDLEGNLFAYMVPLVDGDAGEVGYMTMSAIEDGFPYYMMEWDVELLQAIREALDRDSGAQAVFFPPMEYGLQTWEGDERRITLVSMSDFSLDDVTAEVAENAMLFAQQYQMIRSAENAERTESAVRNSQRVALGLEPRAYLSTAAVTREDVRLSCEWEGTDKFVPVYVMVSPGTKKTYYGGNQSWYDEEKMRNNGCGPVAAANTLCYMSSSSTYKELYPYANLSKTSFKKFMVTMYNTISPGALGETSYSNLANKVASWAKSQGVALTIHKGAIAFGANTASANNIKAGLKKDKPVAIVNLNKFYANTDPAPRDDLGWHWITATKYLQATDDTRWLGLSSWGRRIGVNWDFYYESFGAQGSLGGGYVWFE